MKSKILSLNWKIETENQTSLLTVDESNLVLNFKLDVKNTKHLNEGEKAFLTFSNVHIYAAQSITLEAFEAGEYRYGPKEIGWGEFYMLNKSNWQKDFPKERVVVNKDLKSTNLNHYLICTGDKIVECIAEEFHFKFENDPLEILEKKYPKAYLNYYLSMFFQHFDHANKENYRMMTDLYIQMMGKKEFGLLKEECVTIEKNKDVELLLKHVHTLTFSRFDLKQLKELFKAIANHK